MARPPNRKEPKSTRSTSLKALDSASGVLDRLSAEESKIVLRLLLDEYSQLRTAAEQIARKLLSSPSADEIATQVYEALVAVDLDALNERAGAHSWGYVEPSEAAWELLEESIETFKFEMKRSADLGMMPAATATCAGIVEGLYLARDVKSDGALGWAPDFPAEQAGNLVIDLFAGRTRKTVKGLAEQLDAIFAERTPEWSDMLRKAIAGWLKK